MSALTQERFLRLPEVEAQVGIKKTQIYELMNAGLFPKRIELGPKCVRWPESQVQAWIQSKITEQRGEVAA